MFLRAREWILAGATLAAACRIPVSDSSTAASGGHREPNGGAEASVGSEPSTRTTTSTTIERTAPWSLDAQVSVSNDFNVPARAAALSVSSLCPDLPAETQVALEPTGSCDALETGMKRAASEAMHASLARSLEYTLYQVTHWDETCRFFYGPVSGCDSCAADAPSGAALLAPTAPLAAPEYTGTNVQVRGVDEADLVKTDGAHIYVLSGQELWILRAWPPTQTERLAAFPIEGQPQRLMIEGDRAIIYSIVDASFCGYNGNAFGGRLKLTELDISDRQAPSLIREIWIDGEYVAARRVGSDVHTVVTSYLRGLTWQSWPQDLPWICDAPELSEEDVRAAYARLETQNEAAIAAWTLLDHAPQITLHDARSSSGPVTRSLLDDCGSVFDSDAFASTALSAVVSLSLENGKRVGQTAVFGRGGHVYASAENLYLAASAGDWDAWHTRVHKLVLGKGGKAARYAGSVALPGSLHNQFSMDEHELNLRVATTTGGWLDTLTHVFVLDPDLARIGCVSGLGPGETVRAVRFDGPRGYVVTFKKTDPLFVLDLSDPHAPRLSGELEIPGFSTYIHFLDPGHLLTIGFDADDQGTFAWFQGVLLQIFDVTNMQAPTLAHKVLIGSRGTSSAATADHLAFTYLPSQQLLSVPMGICADGVGGGSYGTTLAFDGLLLFRVDATTGFDYLGGVDHLDPGDATRSSACFNWWETPRSRVKRSIVFADDAETYIDSFSSRLLKVNALSSLAHPVAELPLSPLACQVP